MIIRGEMNDCIRNGTKTIEGRIRRNRIAQIIKGQRIIVTGKKGILIIVVTDINHYSSYIELFNNHQINMICPNMTLQQALLYYQTQKDYSASDELQYGVTAITFTTDILSSTI